MQALTPSERRRRIRLTVIACVAVLVANAVIFVSRMPPSTPETRELQAEKRARSAARRAGVPPSVPPEVVANDSAASLVARYLELSREGSPTRNAAAVDSLLGCQSSGVQYQPSEMLASFRLTGGYLRGDTTVVRAEVITVAEEDSRQREPGRYDAVQRVRRGEWEWDVVREGDRLRVCNGPRFGFYGVDSVTTWRPAGASSVTARALADSIWRATAGAVSSTVPRNR